MTPKRRGLVIGLVFGSLVGSLIGQPTVFVCGCKVLGLTIGSVFDTQHR